MLDDKRPVPTVEQAMAATLACAGLVGLPTGRPEVIAVGYSVRIRLHPSPVLSRVITAGQILRGDPEPWLRREIDVATHLLARGVPVTAPWDQPGPFAVDGLDVSLWRWVDHEPDQRVSVAEFGALLRALHAELDSYPGQLPVLVGPITDIQAALTISDHPTLQAAARALLPRALSWPRRPLHGDAHTSNILVTSSGPVWTDFEDACVGPLEWDLSSRSLSAADEAIDAYGRDAVDVDQLQECRDLRRLQTLAGILTDDVQDASLLAEMTAALSHYSLGS